jgi:hypothetical protein
MFFGERAEVSPSLVCWNFARLVFLTPFCICQPRCFTSYLLRKDFNAAFRAPSADGEISPPEIRATNLLSKYESFSNRRNSWTGGGPSFQIERSASSISKIHA